MTAWRGVNGELLFPVFEGLRRLFSAVDSIGTTKLIALTGVLVAGLSLWWTAIRTLPEILVDEVSIGVVDVERFPGVSQGTGIWLVHLDIEMHFKNTGDVVARFSEFQLDHMDSKGKIETKLDSPPVNPIGPGGTFFYSYSFKALIESNLEKQQILENINALTQEELEDSPHILLTRGKYKWPRFPMFWHRKNQYAFIYRGGSQASQLTVSELQELEIQLPSIYDFP